MAPAAAPPAAPGAVALPAFTLPTLPPELSATIMANVAAVTFDGRRAESIVVVGKLTNQYLELSPVTAKPLGGTAAAAIRVQFGGAFQHAIGVQASGVKVSESFDVLSKIPVFKSIFVAMFAGTPEKVDFTAAADGQLTTQGATLAAMHANLNSPGKGVKAVLTDLTVKGSPMFAAVAAYTNHPELANMTFKQVDAPVLVTNGAVRTNPSVTMPYEEGVFLVTGGTTRDLMANFQMTVKDPAGIRFIPGKVHDYLAAGHPLVIVSGTVLEPKPKVPTQQILTYIAQRALFKRDKKDPKDPKDDKKDTKEKVIEGVLEGLFKKK